MNLESLEKYFEDEMLWRKKEISHFTFAIQNAENASQKRAMLRGAFSLLYAHWEGCFRQTVFLYLKYIRSQDLSDTDLSNEIYAFLVHKKIKAIADQGLGIGVVAAIRDIRGATRVDLKYPKSERDMDVGGNLSSKQLKRYMEFLCLDYDAVVPPKLENFVDDSLLARRNPVAHGEDHDVEESDWDSAKENVLSLLDEIQDGILLAAMEERFLLEKRSV